MAEGKKSFILYSDQMGLFENLDDDEAGRLIKHVFKYVNDLNPEPDKITKIAFEPIKQQLKRDLKSWEKTSTSRSETGKLGGIKSGEARRKQKQANEAIGLITKQNEHDNDNDNDNDNDKKEKMSSPLQDEKVLIIDFVLSKESSLEEKVIKQFHTLFCKFNTIEGKEFNHKKLKEAKMNGWKKDLKGLSEIDKRSRDDLLEVYNFLKNSTDSFWRDTISSLGGIRKHFDTIASKIRQENEKAKKITINPKEESRVMPGNLPKELVNGK